MSARWVIALLVAALGIAAGVSGSARAAWPGRNGGLTFLSAGKIMALGGDGSPTQVVPNPPATYPGTPTWSPDGRWLAWAAYVGVTPSSYTGVDLFTFDSDTGAVRDITNGGVSFSPSWSPDGERLIYGCLPHICIVDRDGANRRQLSVEGSSPAWSPVGTGFAYVATNPADVSSGPAVFTANIDGTHVRRITDYSHSVGTGLGPDIASPPAWSPDGTRMAYVVQQDLTVMDADGGHPRVVAGFAFSNRPAWSPDGAKVAFYTQGDPEGDRGLATIDVAGGGLTLLHDPSTGESLWDTEDPDWRPVHPRSTATPPTVAGRPAISGIAKEGDVLAASSGTWNGDPPMTYEYQWQRCDPSGADCALIGGASATTYSPGGADIGSTLRVVVTASNKTGKASAGSDATGVVAPAHVAPTMRRAHAVWAKQAIRLTVTACSDDGTRLRATATDQRLRRTYTWTVPSCTASTKTWAAKRHKGTAHVIVLGVRDDRGLSSGPVRLTLR